MAPPITTIPIEHHPMIHSVDSSPETEESRQFTLLEVIEAVSEVTDDEQEVIATVKWMLQSGRVRLVGTFRDTPLQQLTG
jgi:hypothetical protein